MTGTDPWRDYRRRRNLSLFSLLGYVAFVFVFGLLPEQFLGTAIPMLIAAISWMAFAGIAGNWFIRFPCPRCGKPFFADSKWWGYNTFTRHCLHCKLPINASDISSNGLPMRSAE